MTAIKERQKFLREERRRFPLHLVDVPSDEWPRKDGFHLKHNYPINVMRSKDFMLQVYEENGMIRLTFSRTMLKGDGNYIDGITWDELQELKRQAGYADFLAIEFYPPDKDIVNVANMRHLWLVKPGGDMPMPWRKGE